MDVSHFYCAYVCRGHGSCDEHQVTETSGREEFAGADDIAGVQQQQAEMLFWFDEAVFEDTALLGGEGKDQLMYDAATTPPTPTPARCLQVESTFPMVESTRRISPHHRQCSFSHEEPKAAAAAAAATASSQKDIIPAAVPSPENVPVEGITINSTNLYYFLLTMHFILVLTLVVRGCSRGRGRPWRTRRRRR
jgi:hypothetical protein